MNDENRTRCGHCRSYLPLEDSLAHVISPERWAERVRELVAENKHLKASLGRAKRSTT